jgi:inosine-uridine nucleoside N-ribohydrolase
VNLVRRCRLSEQIIYDCDNTMGLPRREIDDGLVLLYLLGRPDIELLGVTTTFGNGPIDEVYPQTVQLLRQAGRGEVPVYEGEGERGQAPTEAARFLAETAAGSPGEVTLLATGPLGNIHAASRVDAGFCHNLKRIVCMGGYLGPLRIGWRDLPELNLSANPEAAHSTLHAACPITLMNAQVCLQAPFGWPDLWRARFWDREMRRVVRRWLILCGTFWGVPVFYLWDLLPAVYVSHPELFDKNPVQVRSSVDDLETGRLVVADGRQGRAHSATPSERACVNMPARILDVARFRAILFAAWQRQASELCRNDLQSRESG